MNLVLFSSLLILGVSSLDYEVIRFNSEPKFGRKCGPNEQGQEEIRWYMDMDRNQPYPFKYLGCGDTNGVDYGRARFSGLMDYVPCPGYAPSGGSCVLGAKLIWGPVTSDKKCKESDTCTPMPMVRGYGKCCSKYAEIKYNEDRAAKCSTGFTAVINEKNEWKPTLFGKSCSHDFCPSGSKCVQGHFEAYCCKKQ